MIVRQSTLKTWMECNLKYYWQHEQSAQRDQSSALSWGSTIHEAVLAMEVAGDLQVGIDKFCAVWDDLPAHGQREGDDQARVRALGARAP